MCTVSLVYNPGSGGARMWDMHIFGFSRFYLIAVYYTMVILVYLGSHRSSHYPIVSLKFDMVRLLNFCQIMMIYSFNLYSSDY